MFSLKTLNNYIQDRFFFMGFESCKSYIEWYLARIKKKRELNLKRFLGCSNKNQAAWHDTLSVFGPLFALIELFLTSYHSICNIEPKSDPNWAEITCLICTEKFGYQSMYQLNYGFTLITAQVSQNDQCPVRELGSPLDGFKWKHWCTSWAVI